MRNIRPKLSHVAALDWAVERLGSLYADDKAAVKHVSALVDLLDRCRTASAPEASQPGGLPVGHFVDLARENLPTYAPPVNPTAGWYAKIGRMLRDAGIFDAGSATTMLRYVGRWRKYPVTTEALCMKAAEYLAAAVKAGALIEGEADSSRPPAGLFDD